VVSGKDHCMMAIALTDEDKYKKLRSLLQNVSIVIIKRKKVKGLVY